MILETVQNVVSPKGDRYSFIRFLLNVEEEIKLEGLDSFWLVWDDEEKNFNYGYSVYGPDLVDIEDTTVVEDEYYDEYYIVPHPCSDIDIKVAEIIESNGGLNTIKRMLVDYMI